MFALCHLDQAPHKAQPETLHNHKIIKNTKCKGKPCSEATLKNTRKRYERKEEARHIHACVYTNQRLRHTVPARQRFVAHPSYIEPGAAFSTIGIPSKKKTRPPLGIFTSAIRVMTAKSAKCGSANISSAQHEGFVLLRQARATGS